MGADMVTIDFSGMLTEEDLKAVEREANEVVWENRSNSDHASFCAELEQLPYRSKKVLTETCGL